MPAGEHNPVNSTNLREALETFEQLGFVTINRDSPLFLDQENEQPP
jgi:hypothetical protein